MQKTTGDELLSGSFVERGSLVGRVCRVGQEGYAARINAEAKFVSSVMDARLKKVRKERDSLLKQRDELIKDIAELRRKLEVYNGQ